MVLRQLRRHRLFTTFICTTSRRHLATKYTTRLTNTSADGCFPLNDRDYAETSDFDYSLKIEDVDVVDDDDGDVVFDGCEDVDHSDQFTVLMLQVQLTSDKSVTRLDTDLCYLRHDLAKEIVRAGRQHQLIKIYRDKQADSKSASDLKTIGACDENCWIWHFITQRAYQAAEIIAAVNRISRSYIVPEYSFLDARGLGVYEGKKLQAVSEETVVIISPDPDKLSILQTGLVGLDFRRHNELLLARGEVRYVDASSIPTYKQPPFWVYKCLKSSPNCN